MAQARPAGGRRWHRLLGSYVVAYVLLDRTPLGTATDAQLVDHYGDDRDLTLTLAGLFGRPDCA